ncbi:hypothetical protein Dda_5657 [Drechslerella dactyloides]|uniref:Uncharacterized protein n=1 Tax=Drechslerella dactyloides TaxID=74499 RepID=A0AAD6IX78_DREDA|nr:hypothetical protein Dda_5657 [Drechslerella dactyloides]
MSAAEMFYIPNCETRGPPLRTRLKTGSRSSPSAVLHHAGKRIFDCVVQSLANISLAYGHYPVAVADQLPSTAGTSYSYCHKHTSAPQNIARKAKERPARPLSSCSIHSVPDCIASDHNAREKRKAELQPREKKRRPMSAIMFSRSSTSAPASKSKCPREKKCGSTCRYRYLNEESADSLAELPFLREVQVREFL